MMGRPRSSGRSVSAPGTQHFAAGGGGGVCSSGSSSGSQWAPPSGVGGSRAAPAAGGGGGPTGAAARPVSGRSSAASKYAKPVLAEVVEVRRGMQAVPGGTRRHYARMPLHGQ